MKVSYPMRPYTQNWFPLKESLGQLDMLELQPYGVDPDSCIGGFKCDTKPMWVTAHHPELHIFSLVFCEGLPLYLNRHVSNASFYYLGKGNPDPTIEIYPQPLEPEELARILKRIFAATSQPGEDEADLNRWSRFADNLAYGRPAFDGVLTRAERKARRKEAAKFFGKIPQVRS